MNIHIYIQVGLTLLCEPSKNCIHAKQTGYQEDGDDSDIFLYHRDSLEAESCVSHTSISDKIDSVHRFLFVVCLFVVVVCV